VIPGSAVWHQTMGSHLKMMLMLYLVFSESTKGIIVQTEFWWRQEMDGYESNSMCLA
jgi:hypothetical protein